MAGGNPAGSCHMNARSGRISDRRGNCRNPGSSRIGPRLRSICLKTVAGTILALAVVSSGLAQTISDQHGITYDVSGLIPIGSGPIPPTANDLAVLKKKNAELAARLAALEKVEADRMRAQAEADALAIAAKAAAADASKAAANAAATAEIERKRASYYASARALAMAQPAQRAQANNPASVLYAVKPDGSVVAIVGGKSTVFKNIEAAYASGTIPRPTASPLVKR